MEQHITLVRKEGKVYVSWCPDLDLTASGKTPEKAVEILEEAIYHYLDGRRAGESAA